MITHPALMLLLLSNFASLEVNAFRAPLIKVKVTQQTSTLTTPASRTIKTWLNDGMSPLADVDATTETADTTTALVDGGGSATAILQARFAKVIKPRPYGCASQIKYKKVLKSIVHCTCGIWSDVGNDEA
jgi:hypothetical protein